MNIVNSEPFQGKQSTQRIIEALNHFVDMQDHNKTRTFFVTSICDVRLCEEKNALSESTNWDSYYGTFVISWHTKILTNCCSFQLSWEYLVQRDAHQLLAFTRLPNPTVFPGRNLFLIFPFIAKRKRKMSDEELQTVFKSFCAFGAGSKDAQPEMDNAKFAKLFRDLKLYDKKFTSTDTDIIFNRPEVKK